MSYYNWSNRKELLGKAHDKYHNKGGKEKAAEYYKKEQINDKRKRKKQIQDDAKRRKE